MCRIRPKAIESANQLGILSLVANPLRGTLAQLSMLNSDRIHWRHFLCICTSGMEQAPLAQAKHALGKWDYGGGGDEEDVAAFLDFLAQQEP